MNAQTKKALRFVAQAAAAAVVLTAARTAAADDHYWVGGNSSWQVNANWSHTAGGAGGVGPPAAGDAAYLYSASTITITRDSAATSYTYPGMGEMHIDGTGGAQVTLKQSASSLAA